MTKLSQFVFWSASTLSVLYAQQAPPAQAANPNLRSISTYILGPGDQLLIRAFEVEEIGDRPYRTDAEGDVNLPVLGKVHAGGLTVEQFEAALIERMKTIVKNPQVTVTLNQLRAEPVFVTGAFKTPGLYTLQGGRTLLDIVTAAGGLQTNASRRIRVTRRLDQGVIPLPNAVVDQDKRTSSVDINVKSLRDNLNPAEDVNLKPFDTINVDTAEMVYATGEFNRVGGVELGEREAISVTQLISMVGGLGRDAAPEKARVLRPVLNTSRRAEIPVDLKKVLSGKESDFPLVANDVLYVPRNGRAQVLGKVGVVAIPAATALIYVLVTKL
jgi:polysaccharide export outer membrane protein